MSALLSPSIPATPPAAGPEPYRFSVAQYHAMIDANILTEADRVELLRGVVVRKMAKKSPHRIACNQVRLAVGPILPHGWHDQVQDPITLADSEPEPDYAIARGWARDYDPGHPTPAAIGLVVEVSDSTLAYDRGEKRRMYAEAGIPTYWIVNVVDRVLEVHTDPQAGDYATVVRLGPADAVTLTLDGTALPPIPVRDMLP